MTQNRQLPKIDVPGVALRLEVLRAALGLQKGQFADSFGLDASSYSKMIQSKKPLKAEMAYSIAARWGVTMDFIYRGDMSKMDEALRAKYIAALNAPQQ